MEGMVPMSWVAPILGALATVVVTLFWLLMKSQEKVIDTKEKFMDKYVDMIGKYSEGQAVMLGHVDKSTEALNTLIRLIEKLNGGNT